MTHARPDAPPEPPVAGLPDGAAVLRSVIELVLAAVIGAVVAAGVFLLIDRAVLPRPSFVPDALTTLAAVMLTAGLVALLLRAGWAWWRTVAVWVALAALPAVTLCLLLSGTRLYLNGLGGDQSFRTAYLARMASSPALADMTYADLPPYYPAGWFWLAGRVTALSGLDAWAAYKPLAVITMGVAGAIGYSAWSAVVGRRVAVPAAVACVLAGLRFAAYEPYSWLLAVLLPPIAVLAWSTFRAAVRGAPGLVAPAVALGGYLGVAGAVYSLLAVASGLLGAVAATAALILHGPGRSVRAVLTVCGIAVAVAVPIAALVWTPYVLAGGLGATSAAQRFLPAVGAGFPLPFLEPSASGVLSAVGLVWIVVRAAQRRVAAGLALLVGTVYLWYALSLLALAAGSTLLPFRMEPPLMAALWVGATFALVDGFRLARRSLPEPRPVLAAVAVLAVVVTAGLTPGTREAHPELVEAAFTDYTPDGIRASGPSDPADPGAWNDELAAAISTTARPPADLVVLTSYYPLLSHAPYRGFQVAVAQYANPLADFDGRRALIESWARSGDLPEQLDRSPFRAPDVFVLDRRPDGLYLRLTADAFPRDPANVPVDVRFDATVFDDPAFVRQDVGPFVVVVRTR